jgi:alkylmercury lyase
MTQIDSRVLADQLVAAGPALDDQQQRIAIALYRLLADGQPVSREQLAQRTGALPGDVERVVDEQPGVYLDDHARGVGFWGLALDGMPHRMTVRGHAVRGWCAWDTLFLPDLLGETATVASTCPTTAETVELVVTPEGVREVSPAGAVLSFLGREQPLDADTIKTFCHYVHFFASRQAAIQWTAEHPGTFVLSIDEGAEICAPRQPCQLPSGHPPACSVIAASRRSQRTGHGARRE